MLWLYRILFLPVLMFLSPYYLWRIRKRGGYRRHFGHRFGKGIALPQKRPDVHRIWLQAVSVGEMLAIGPVLAALKADPSVEVYLTTTTSTGFKLAGESYQDRVIGIGYFPIDWWLFSWIAWRRIKPDLAIITEGERWPEHVHQAQCRSIRMLCLNARLSDRSFYRMKRWRRWIVPLFDGITRVLAASEHDAARFCELGFAPSRVSVTGNIKLDLVLPVFPDAEKDRWRKELGIGRIPVLLGASTWPGEELALLEALRALRQAGIAAGLLIVPRHAERRGEIESLLRESGFSFHFRSKGAAEVPIDVVVGDTTGELRHFVQLAEVIFVGKSLPPHEQGQTPVEAAAAGKAIVFGPGMSNFRAIVRELVEEGAACPVTCTQELVTTIVDLFERPEQRTALAEAATRWHRANQGAVNRSLDAIQTEVRLRK